jgi:hypothetical protein
MIYFGNYKRAVYKRLRYSVISGTNTTMRASGKQVSVFKIANRLERSFSMYKKLRSQCAQIDLAQKVLEAIIQLFDIVSLRSQQRDEAMYHMQKVFYTLETFMMKAKNNDFMLLPKKQISLHEMNNKGLKIIFHTIKKLRKIKEEDLKPRMAVKLAAILADVGKIIYCEEEFNALMKFIIRQLIDDEDERTNEAD